MNYKATTEWMFAKLPMYQSVGSSAYKADLKGIQELVAYLGHPHNQFKSIHVGGTNGKGSTSHMLASILKEQGYNVGLFTSPHLKDFRERIRIDGVEISKDYVVDFVAQHRPFFESNFCSFFEMTAGMAFSYFADQNVDIAIIEVGLGGRLDATNVISPEVSVITNIGLDHTQFLGTTLEAIAIEKAGIIKDNTPVVIGETHPETEDIFKTVSQFKNTTIVFADTQLIEPYFTDLKGKYQVKNIRTAVAVVKVLNQHGFGITESAIQQGFEHVVHNTNLRGRWEYLGTAPQIIVDTAHNKAGLTTVLQQLTQLNYSKLHIVLGMVNDKAIETIIPLFPKEATYYFCSPQIQRAMQANDLFQAFFKKGYEGEAYGSVIEAYTSAQKEAQAEDVLFVGGSGFVVAEVL